MHVTDGGLLERLLAAQWPLAGDGLLEVGIQTFIGVEFGAVGRQVEDLDLRLVPANQSRTNAERCTGRRSRIRNTLRPASLIRRCRKQISNGALIAPASTLQGN